METKNLTIEERIARLPESYQDRARKQPSEEFVSSLEEEVITYTMYLYEKSADLLARMQVTAQRNREILDDLKSANQEVRKELSAVKDFLRNLEVRLDEMTDRLINLSEKVGSEEKE